MWCPNATKISLAIIFVHLLSKTKENHLAVLVTFCNVGFFFWSFTFLKVRVLFWYACINKLCFDTRFDYSVCVNRSKRFYPEIRKYYANLKDGSLEPGYAGIRPKLSGPRQSPVDFLIQVISSTPIFYVNLYC